MLQSFEPSQTKERPRAILGRLQVSARPPSNYGEWSANGDYLQPPGIKTKVNRSQSFSDSGAGLNRNVLLPPDPRRFSFASNESALSSNSSLSEIWAGPGTQTGAGASVWGPGGGDNDLTMGLCTGTLDLRRRGSDSDCFNLRQRQQQQQDLDLFAWHEARRRSSGYVSDGSGSSVSPGTCSISPVSRQFSPGMEYVPAWLKHLRLHKYTEYIMSLTYQELLELTDDKLQKMNVTQGARKKLLLNIEKLSERPQALIAIGTTLENDDCDIKNVLADLESIIRSPIYIEDVECDTSQECATDSGAEVSDDEETTGDECASEKQQVTGQQLVQMIMKTLKKTTSVFLLSEHMDGKLITHLTQLLDVCLSQSYFNIQQKQFLSSWKQKVLSLWEHLLASTAGKREPKVKFGFPHQSFRTTFTSSSRSLRDRNRSPSMQEVAQGNMRYADSAQHNHPPNFFLQRKSAPNIHSLHNTSFNPLTYQKRHSFQEGIPYSHDQINFGGDSFWRNADNYVLMPEFNSHTVQPPTRIFVTCEDDIATDELDEMDSNMENLCKAVTEQALE